jgi:hypothetical protein
MPATLVASHVASSAPAAVAVSLSDLSNGERTVALYASDMPDRFDYKRGDHDRLVAWIIQGATRMGLERLHCTAALDSGYRRCFLAKRLTPELKRAQTERFPSPKRLRRAGELAALVTHNTRGEMSDAARERSGRYLLDGPCPDCGDARQVWRRWVVDAEVDLDWYEEGYGPCWLCGGAA